MVWSSTLKRDESTARQDSNGDLHHALDQSLLDFLILGSNEPMNLTQQAGARLIEEKHPSSSCWRNAGSIQCWQVCSRRAAFMELR